MSKEFNGLLVDFLIEYNEVALNELKLNKIYAERHSKLFELQSRFESKLSPDNKALWEEYIEAREAIKSMEVYTIFLSALTLQANISKRFDINSLEFQQFSEILLK